MKRLIIILFFTCTSSILWSQTLTKAVVDSAKFLIVKATVNFLVTDSKTFGGNKSICRSCMSYESLKEFAIDKKLSKVPEYINNWKSIKIDTTQESAGKSLSEFKNRVHDTITSGAKEFRKKLNSYPDYKITIDSIVEYFNTFYTSSNTNTQSSTTQTVETKISIVPAMSWWQKKPAFQYVLYGTTFLLAIGLIFFIRQAKRENKSKKSYKDANNEKSQLLERNTAEIDALKKSNTSLQEKIVLLEEELKAERKKLSIQNQVSVKQQEQPAKQETRKKISNIKYARYADQGDGFTASDFLAESDSETIFEITITSPNTAYYKIAPNANAQKYALSDAAYFLGKTCKYESAPFGQSNIHTDQPGELKLQGNKWAIISPAIISFR